MNNLCCPTCNVALMEHDLTCCLWEWTAKADGDDFSLFGHMPSKAWQMESAYALMGKVWEMDARAAILKETIFIQVAGNKAPQHIPIDGSTFPLRVCRAFLFLKAKESAT